jgi:ribosome-associated protein
MARIAVAPGVFIDDSELAFSFARAGGPGGQNVNKVETAVHLRFDVVHSPSLEQGVRHRLSRLAGGRLTKDGILVIDARSHRTQEQNRRAALERLLRLIAAAVPEEKPRLKTRPTFGSKIRRLESKVRRGETKRLRNAPVQ